MEIPDSLIGIRRVLDKHGHSLKKIHGPGFRRNVKFDDGELSLYMDVCLPNENDWMRIDYADALEANRAEQRIAAISSRVRLTSSQSSVSADEEMVAPASSAIVSTFPVSAKKTSTSGATSQQQSKA